MTSDELVITLDYLGFSNDTDYKVFEDKAGQIMLTWLSTIAQPTQAEIDAAILPAKRAQIIEQINAEATKRILQAYPLEKQSSANLGIYPQAYTDKMIADIAAVIAASNTACDAVDAAVDVAGVDAVVVNWPVIGA